MYTLLDKAGNAAFYKTQKDLVNAFDWTFQTVKKKLRDGKTLTVKQTTVKLKTALVNGKRSPHTYDVETWTENLIKLDMLQYVSELLGVKIFKSTPLYAK